MPGPRKLAVSVEASEYELNIQKSRADIKALLDKLKSDCADNGILLPKGVTTTKPTKQFQRKRKTDGPTEPSRKSARISKQAVSMQELSSDDDNEPIIKKKIKKQTLEDNDRDSSDEQMPNRQPRVNGRVFGPIKGVKVGMWWEYRDECGRAGVHAPTVAGIYGGSEEGAYSVAVSAGYPEDRDLGDTFTYTGSGGRELKKKNLRTAPQSSDQVLTRGNAALDKSAQTGNPIRVIRGFKAALGPVTGYRYDGLYKVVRSYQTLNAEGRFKVYKFDFERLPGQPPVDYGLKERILTQREIEQQLENETATATNMHPTPPSSEGETEVDIVEGI